MNYTKNAYSNVLLFVSALGFTAGILGAIMVSLDYAMGDVPTYAEIFLLITGLALALSLLGGFLEK